MQYFLHNINDNINTKTAIMVGIPYPRLENEKLYVIRGPGKWYMELGKHTNP